MSLEYRIEPSVFDAHPGYRRGLLVVRGARNATQLQQLQDMLRAEEARLRERLREALGERPVTEHPVLAAWRAAYRAFGARPSEHRSAIEALTRRVLKPDRLPSINALVDIGNIVSLRHILPVGAHPRPPAGVLALRRAAAGDVFMPADGGAPEVPTPPEIVFCHGKQVLTRRWTWRQAAGTQTLPGTQDVIFNIDGLPPTSEEKVQQAMHDIAQLVQAFTGATVVLSTVLSAERPQCPIP